MKVHTSIAMLAAALAPVYAQQSSAPDSPLSTSVPAAPLTPAQPAAKSADVLAAIPANLDFYLAINGIDKAFGALGDAPVNSDISSMAIGAEKGAGKTLLILKSLMDNLSSLPCMMEMAAKEQYLDLMDEELEKIEQKQMQQVLDSEEKLYLPPVYFVLKAAPGRESDFLPGFISDVSKSGKNYSDLKAEAEEINGFQGFVLKTKPDSQPETMQDKVFVKVLNDLHPHILVKQLDSDKAIVVICSDPADIKLATDKASSALSIPGVVPYEETSGNEGILSYYASPEFSETQSHISISQWGTTAAAYAQLYRMLAASDEGRKEVFEQAALSIETLAQQMQAAANAYQITQPTTLHTWFEGKDIRTRLSIDAMGYEFQRGQLKLKAKAAAPSTIFYAESTPLTATAATPKWDFSASVQPLFNIARGLLAMMPEEQAAEGTHFLQMAETFLPETRLLGSAIGDLLKGFNGQAALVVDSAGELPPVLAQPGNGTPMPRLGIYAGVENRGKLAEGWQEILSAAGKIATRLGADPSVINMLPIAAVTNGETASYSVVLPGASEHLQPNVTLNNSSLAIGTSPTLNADLLQSATGSDDFSGCEFVLNLDALTTIATGINTHVEQLRQATTHEVTYNMEGPAKQEVCQATCSGDTAEAATQDDEGDDTENEAPEADTAATAPDANDEDTEEDDDEEEDDDDDMEVTYSASPYDETAMWTGNFSTILQFISQYADQINGNYTIRDGKVNLQINIRRK